MTTLQQLRRVDGNGAILAQEDYVRASRLLPISMGKDFRVAEYRPIEISNVADKVIDGAASFSYIFRLFPDGMPVVSGSPLFAPHYCQPITGLTTVPALFQGIVGLFKAASCFSRAILRGDNEAKAVAAGDFTFAMSLCGLGLSFLMQRIVNTLALVKQGPNARSPLGASLTLAGTLFLIFLPILSGIKNVYDMWKIRQLQNQLQNSDDPNHDPIAFLNSKLNPTTEDLAQMSNPEKNRLLQEALFYGVMHYKQMVLDENGVVMESDPEIKAMLIDKFGEKRLQLEILTLKNRQALEPISDRFAQIEDAATLPNVPKIYKELLVAAMNTEATDRLKKKAFELMINAVGATLLILSLIYTAGLPLFVVAAGLAVMEIRALVSTARDLANSLQKGEFGKDDQKTFKVSIATCLLSIGLIAALTATLPVGLFATAPLILAGIIALGWLLINVVSLKKSQENERAQIEREMNEATTFAPYTRYAATHTEEENEVAYQQLRRRMDDHRRALIDQQAQDEEAYNGRRMPLDQLYA